MCVSLCRFWWPFLSPNVQIDRRAFFEVNRFVTTQVQSPFRSYISSKADGISLFLLLLWLLVLNLVEKRNRINQSSLFEQVLVKTCFAVRCSSPPFDSLAHMFVVWVPIEKKGRKTPTKILAACDVGKC